MKVYVLYVLSDYAHAVYMSINRHICEKEKENYHNAWIEEYNFSKAKGYELNGD